MGATPCLLRWGQTAWPVANGLTRLHSWVSSLCYSPETVAAVLTAPVCLPFKLQGIRELFHLQLHHNKTVTAVPAWGTTVTCAHPWSVSSQLLIFTYKMEWPYFIASYGHSCQMTKGHSMQFELTFYFGKRDKHALSSPMSCGYEQAPGEPNTSRCLLRVLMQGAWELGYVLVGQQLARFPNCM